MFTFKNLSSAIFYFESKSSPKKKTRINNIEIFLFTCAAIKNISSSTCRAAQATVAKATAGNIYALLPCPIQII